MKLGLALPHYDFSFPDAREATIADVVAYARRAEDAGFDSVWISDHLFLDLAKYGGPDRRFRTPEAFAMLGALATQTERVRIGSLVLCAPFRNAHILAAQAAGVAALSGGRLELGIGAGWYEAEFDAAGIPFGSAGSRIRHLADVARVLSEAPSPRAPLWIGGKGGPKVAAVVAEHADGWNTCWRVTPEEYAGRLEVLADACARAGRDPESVAKSVGLYALLGRDHADVAARYERLRAWMPGVLDATSLETFAAGILVGTPAECAARVKEFEALGVTDLILSLASVPFGVFEDDQIGLAAEMLPLIR